MRAASQQAAPAHAQSGPQPPIQLKAKIGPVDDPLEREADKIADAVVSGGPVGAVGGGDAETARRACAQCDEDQDSVRRKETASGTPAHGAANAAAAVSQGGAPLTPAQRRYFEPRFGRDFSEVRIHTDASAASAASGMNARAYTLGHHIGFASGEYRHGSLAGDRLMAHELAHVAQAGSARIIRRAPATDKSEEKPADASVEFHAKDLLVYPLFIDLWDDLFAQKLTDAQKKEFKLKGQEGEAVWNALFGAGFGAASLDPNPSVSDFLEAWVKNAKEIHKIAVGSDKSFVLDLFSSVFRLNLDAYTSSDLFKSRIKKHALALASVFAVAQTALSIVEAKKDPSAKTGEFEPTQYEKQTLLVAAVINLIMADQFKAPDFFNIGPLKLETHPAFAAGASPTEGGGPTELTFENRKGQGDGQGGELMKLGLTLNLPQLVGLFQKDAPPAKEVADLQKYRGWQGSIWLSFDETDPTKLQLQAGKLPYKAFKAGTLFGGGGFLGELEGGARYSGDEAKDLSGWFVRGGFGYSGKKGAVLQRLGFTATYTDWTDTDIYAPRIGEGGAPVGGHAAQFSPFTKLEFGHRHKFGVGAALGFVTGTHEDFSLSDVRGDLSYTYMGDHSEDQLPVFKLDLSTSVSRLDWFASDSPTLTGVQARGSAGRYFVAGQLNTGAGQISDQRAAQLGEKTDIVKAKVPTTVLFTAGANF